MPSTALSVDIVLFAIQSAIKMGRQIRTAYVDCLRNRELILPYIDFPSAPDFISAIAFFESDGSMSMDLNVKIKELYEKALNNQIQETDPEGKEFMLLFQEQWSIGSAEKKAYLKEGFDDNDVRSLMEFRQWIRGGEQNPSALQRIAGTIVEIGVDYFASIPGALRKNSSHSRVIKGFLNSIEDVNFAESHLDIIVEDLFIGAIEALGENADLLSGDIVTQELVEVISKGIIKDVEQKLKKVRENGGANLAKEEQIQLWAQLIFRSVLSNSGKVVLSNPAKFLNVPTGGKSAMVSAVGNAIFDGLITDEGIDIGGVFNRNAIDKIVKAALATLAANPELIDVNNKGLKMIIVDVASDLSELSGAIDADLLAEVIRLILEKTSQRLDLVWPEDANDPKKHLLIIAAKETLEVIAAKPDGEDESWKPVLKKKEVSKILEIVFDEVIQNPGWVLKEVEQTSSRLKEVLKEVLESFNRIPKANRLSSEVMKNIIWSSIKAVALREQFIDKIPIGGAGQEKYLISYALDSIFGLIFKEQASVKAHWVAVQGNVISSFVKTSLNKLAIEGVTEELIKKISQIIANALKDYADNKKFSMEEIENQIMAISL